MIKNMHYLEDQLIEKALTAFNSAMQTAKDAIAGNFQIENALKVYVGDELKWTWRAQVLIANAIFQRSDVQVEHGLKIAENFHGAILWDALEVASDELLLEMFKATDNYTLQKCIVEIIRIQRNKTILVEFCDYAVHQYIKNWITDDKNTVVELHEVAV